MTKIISRLLTPKPARYLKLKIRRQLREHAEAGLKTNWKYQPETRFN